MKEPWFIRRFDSQLYLHQLACVLIFIHQIIMGIVQVIRRADSNHCLALTHPFLTPCQALLDRIKALCLAFDAKSREEVKPGNIPNIVDLKSIFQFLGQRYTKYGNA
ncbi:hypothetical protein D3C81_1356830 [compost metagenome]